MISSALAVTKDLMAPAGTWLLTLEDQQVVVPRETMVSVRTLILADAEAYERGAALPSLGDTTAAALRRENEALRAALAERDAEIAQLKRRLAVERTSSIRRLTALEILVLECLAEHKELQSDMIFDLLPEDVRPAKKTNISVALGQLTSLGLTTSRNQPGRRAYLWSATDEGREWLAARPR